MYPGEYEYHCAESVDHALELLAEQPDAELLAGGHSLLPAIERGLADPDAVIDIGEIDAIQGIEFDGDTAHIGAVTTYAAIDETAKLWDGATALAEAASELGDTQVRNRGTIGGNLADPVYVSDLSAAIIVSDGTIVVEGGDGTRRVDADAFFSPAPGFAADELLTKIEVPLETGTAGGAYVKKKSSSSRYTVIGVAARLRVDQGRITTARIAANGVTEHGIGLDSVAAALEGETPDKRTIEAAAARAGSALDSSELIDDSQASAGFRADLLPTYTERALKRAAERAGISIPA